MSAKLRAHLTYANVVSTLCLFIALGGTSYAVATNSIDSREIKNNSVRSKDVRNGSLLTGDFKPGQVLGGSQGPEGPRGPQGDQGTKGASGATNLVVRSTSIPFGDGESKCNADEVATGGGVGALSVDAYLSKSEPTSTGGVPNGWLATIRLRSTGFAAPGTVYVICASP